MHGLKNVSRTLIILNSMENVIYFAAISFRPSTAVGAFLLQTIKNPELKRLKIFWAAGLKVKQNLRLVE
jgi:hypothetical protein